MHSRPLKWGRSAVQVGGAGWGVTQVLELLL